MQINGIVSYVHGKGSEHMEMNIHPFEILRLYDYTSAYESTV